MYLQNKFQNFNAPGNKNPLCINLDDLIFQNAATTRKFQESGNVFFLLRQIGRNFRPTTLFFYKNKFYKNAEADILGNIKNIFHAQIINLLECS